MSLGKYFVGAAVVLSFVSGCGNTVIQNGATGTGGAARTGAVVSSSSTSGVGQSASSATGVGGSSTVVSSSSTGGLPACSQPTLSASWYVSTVSGIGCGDVMQVVPTSCNPIDTTNYAQAFQLLRDRLPAKVEFHFEFFQGGAALRIYSPGGSADVTVQDWSECDMQPAVVVESVRTLVDTATLDACSNATTAADQVSCVQSLFAGASQVPPSCKGWW